MQSNREIATWLLANRPAIEAALGARLGAAAPRAAGPEAETLRRFRTFAATALMRDQAPPPALDGLSPNERRVMALLAAWSESACALAEDDGERLRSALTPLLEQFRLALRTSTPGRRSKGKPRASRRAVSAAIDRIADGFLAVDTDSGRIVDANPAAGAMLGVERDALLEVDALSFVPPTEHRAWWAQLDGLAEGSEAPAFRTVLCDVKGVCLGVDASMTAYVTRGRTLALFTLRPALGAATCITAGEAQRGGAVVESAPAPFAGHLP